MPDEPKKSTVEIKVTDRRAFTNEGSRRHPTRPEEEESRPSAAQVLPPPPPIKSDQTKPVLERDEVPEGIDFGGFVQYLGQIAVQQMLGTTDPSTGESREQLADAQQTIEILTMLKEKTQGNLTPEESQSLDQLLYHLKLEYARRAAPAGQ